MTDKCARGDCDRPAERKGLCRKHYDRERGPRHRHREDRVLANRARNRAVTALVKAHPVEFQMLLEAARAEVAREHAELLKVAVAMGAEPTGDRRVVRLRPGPPTSDEDSPADRIASGDTQRGCASCSRYHERGHGCPVCGTKPQILVHGYRYRGNS